MQTAARVRIYCDHGDRWEHQPLVTAVVRQLWKSHAAGVTVMDGAEGFGASRQLHPHRRIDLGANRPVLIEWLDAPDRVEAIWPAMAPMLQHALVTQETVTLLVGPHYGLRRLPLDATVGDVMQRTVVAVQADALLPDVVATMHDNGVRFVPVLDDERLIGVVSNGDLVQRGGVHLRLELQQAVGDPVAEIPADRRARDVMTSDPITVAPGVHLREAAQLMMQRRVKRVPVVHAGALVGLVSRIDLLRTVAHVASAADDGPRAEHPRTIGDVAVAHVPTVHESTTVADVLDAVVSTRLNRAVVIDDGRRVVGIVSDAEVLRRIGSRDRSLVDRLMRRSHREADPVAHGTTARDLMVAPVVTVPRSMPIAEAIRRMLDDHRKLLPVVDDDGRLCGMVDRADALRAAFAGQVDPDA